MVSTVDDTKRLAIGTKLVDMKALQNLLISNEEKFIQDCTKDDIHKRLQDMLEDDRKNLGVLDTAIVQYGVHGELQETTQKLIEQVQKLMESSED
jgi:DNA transposition AAA+ family ATPase